MTTPAGGAEQPVAPTETTGLPRAASRRRAAGIYGTIVTASVLATAGGHLRTVPLAVAVFVTLLVYWLAEEYAELGEHATAGHLPTWARTRADLAAKWPMVTPPTSRCWRCGGAVSRRLTVDRCLCRSGCHRGAAPNLRLGRRQRLRLIAGGRTLLTAVRGHPRRADDPAQVVIVHSTDQLIPPG